MTVKLTLSDRLRNALADLSPTQQQLLSARYLEGDEAPTDADLSQRFNRSEDAIRTGLMKARDQLSFIGGSEALQEFLTCRPKPSKSEPGALS